jgi:outer membrane protein OmpA-like peptidoglycan-associated protein
MTRIATLLIAAALLAGCAVFRHEAPAVYMVFFTSSNTALTAESRAIVDGAAAAIRSAHPEAVNIAAGIATGDNLKLAQARFETVRQALVADGVADAMIARTAIADASLSVGATGDQRVEIRMVGKAQP